MQVSTIGLDIAKNVFQVHGVDEEGKVVITRQLRRGQVIVFFKKLAPCLIGMEACATAHHWGRELTELGHTVRLMPASYVKAYVKRSKNDAVDAAASCEAVTRPSMRFVPIKTIDQQAALMLHRSRSLLIRQRTQLINALRAHLAELGLIAAKGKDGVKGLVTIVIDGANSSQLPEPMRQALFFMYFVHSRIVCNHRPRRRRRVRGRPPAEIYNALRIQGRREAGARRST